MAKLLSSQGPDQYQLGRATNASAALRQRIDQVSPAKAGGLCGRALHQPNLLEANPRAHRHPGTHPQGCPWFTNCPARQPGRGPQAQIRPAAAHPRRTAQGSGHPLKRSSVCCRQRHDSKSSDRTGGPAAWTGRPVRCNCWSSSRWAIGSPWAANCSIASQRIWSAPIRRWHWRSSCSSFCGAGTSRSISGMRRPSWESARRKCAPRPPTKTRQLWGSPPMLCSCWPRSRRMEKTGPRPPGAGQMVSAKEEGPGHDQRTHQPTAPRAVVGGA